MNIRKYFLIFLSIVPLYSFACDCSWQGNFLEVASSDNFIAHVKVIELRKENYDFDVVMTVQIIQKLNGQENAKIITIWGDRGSDCRVNLKQFEKGKEYIIAADKLKNNSYAISNCGEYYLEIIKRKISNNKNDSNSSDNSKTRIRLKKFIKTLNKKIEQSKEYL